MSNFWASFKPIDTTKIYNGTPETLVDGPFKATPGASEPIPYHFLPGSGADPSIDPNEIRDTVDEYFPFYDGVTKIWDPPYSEPPAEINTAPGSLDPEEFLSWHSTHQLYYIDKQGTGSPKTVTLLDSDGNKLNALANAAGNRVLIIEHLQKTDIARLPLVDQERIAGNTAFNAATGVAFLVGLLPVTGSNIVVGSTTYPTDTPANTRTALTALANASKAAMVSVSGTLLTAADAKVFTDQVDLLIGKLAKSGVFSKTEFQKQLTEIYERYERAEAFGTVPAESAKSDTWETDSGFPFYDKTYHSETSPTEFYNVVSLDNNQTINSGYAKFMEQERRLLAFANERLKIATTGQLENKKLDVPNLVFLLQLNYNLTIEAKVIINTEEVNQQNALLQTYGRMQQLVNAASKAFGTDQEESRNISGGDTADALVRDLSVENGKLISMFEDILGGNGTLHPIEKLRGITRPLHDSFNQSSTDRDKLNEFRKTQWDSFNTQLSDTVTLINQENQIKMNDINSMNKQKDRHFDLANGALSKMFDTIQNIARATGN